MSTVSLRQSHKEWLILGGLAVIILFGTLAFLGRNMIKQTLPLRLVNGIKSKIRLATEEHCQEPDGSTVEDAIEELEAATEDNRLPAIARLGAGMSLVWAKQAVPRLTTILSSEKEEERLEALLALSRLSNTAMDALPAVVKCLDDENGDVRQAAVEYLALFGKKSHPSIRQALQSPSDREFASVANLMSRCPRFHFYPYEERVRRLAGDRDITIRTQIAAVLGRLTSPEAVSTLHALLKDEESQVRIAAIQSLDRMPTQARTLATTLKPLLQEPDTQVKFAVINTLSHHPEHSSVVKLIEELEQQEQDESTVQVLSRARSRMAYQVRSTRR
jgi:HEAT repeat protein